MDVNAERIYAIIETQLIENKKRRVTKEKIKQKKTKQIKIKKGKGMGL